MSERRSTQIDALLSERIAAGDFPSAVYLIGEQGRIVFEGALGNAVSVDDTQTASLDTIYDLASLTKPLVTGLLIASRIEAGELSLEDTVAKYLSEFNAYDKRTITVRQLATHTSGLPAWLPLSIATNGERGRALEVIASQMLQAAPGTHVRYSDLGFITLGFLLEKISGGAPLAEIARREIFAPLELHSTFFNPPAQLRSRIAASETGNFYERGMSEEQGAANESQNAPQAKLQKATQAWREHLIHGEVHDGNAYFLGGAAGHAGLFSTARDTFRLAQQFIANETHLLAAQTCALFRTNMTKGLEEARSLAWQLAATKDSTAGTVLPPDSFGHLGFTGTSCWIDPVRERVFVLLTNRTHARLLPFANINGVRRRFHALAVAAPDEAKSV